MQTLTLNDGTVVNGHILADASESTIFVYMDELSLAEGFALLSDTSKTEKIVASSYGNEHVYEGYTTLSAISDEYGNCNAVLKKR